MYQKGSRAIVFICIVLMVILTVLKIVYPSLVYFNSGFVFVILLTILARNAFFTKLVGWSAVGIVIILAIATKQYNSKELLLPQILSCIVLVITMFISLQIKKLYSSIEKEKTYLDALFKFATEGVILTNKNGEIVLINPASLKLFGYEEEEVLGQKIEILIPKRFTHNHHKYRDQFYDKPGNRSMGHGRDLYAKKKSGDEFPVEVSLSYFKLKDEMFVIAFIVDITQRKEAEVRLIEQKNELEKITRQVRKLNSELENKVEERTLILREALHELERSQQELSDALDKEKELNEIKSRFVSMASHEFRTPLSTVLSSASLISKYVKGEEQEKREKHIRKIKDSVKHLNDLLEDFLSLGKLEEGKVARKVESFVVRDVIEDTLEEIRPVLKPEQSINLDLDDTHSIYSDKKLLKNILINIISNAAKFSPEGASIDVVAKQQPDYLQVSVTDKGIGISEEDQQHLFSSFFRAKNAFNIQGTGLGLHIVKRYLDLIDGKIFLDSKLDEGTTVTFHLPDLGMEDL